MTMTERKVIKAKVGLLELAKELGSVTQACRVMGYSRDRLLLISAFATALQTLLGAVGESLGMAQLLKSNTARTRTHSLFRQGCILY